MNADYIKWGNSMSFKNKVVYQIYPMSFNDGNNDGMGDIKGIIEKIPYLKKLGVDMLWITPVYSSPKYDNGYDIADYYSIDPQFGTMEEFEKLILEAQKLDIGIIMDIVANHTSTHHEWFKKAMGGDEKYQDFYVFRDKKFVENHPITSIFGGDAWEFVEELNLYYLHNFDKTQADLDWDNDKVREEIYKVLNFWLEKGVKGFRFDVIDMISKDWDKRSMSNGPRLHEYIKEMNKKSFGKYDTLTVGETWSADTEHAKLYSNPDGSEFSMVFTFEHIMYTMNKWETAIDKQKLKTIFDKYQNELHGKGWNSLFFNNHDLPRVISRYGDEKFREITGKQWAMILHCMAGTPFIYQGEEIGMTNRFWSKEEIRDVEAINYYNEATKIHDEKYVLDKINKISRDNARTPMQWDNSDYAGFSTKEPWIVVNENYKKINVKNALEDKNSLFYTYQNLIKLRKTEDVITEGKFELINFGEDIFAYKREYKDTELIVISNLTNKDVMLDSETNGKPIMNNYGNSSNNNDYKAYETRVYLKKQKDTVS